LHREGGQGGLSSDGSVGYRKMRIRVSRGDMILRVSMTLNMPEGSGASRHVTSLSRALDELREISAARVRLVTTASGAELIAAEFMELESLTGDDRGYGRDDGLR
jgi:hypothetical protein